MAPCAPGHALCWGPCRPTAPRSPAVSPGIPKPPSRLQSPTVCRAQKEPTRQPRPRLPAEPLRPELLKDPRVLDPAGCAASSRALCSCSPNSWYMFSELVEEGHQNSGPAPAFLQRGHSSAGLVGGGATVTCFHTKWANLESCFRMIAICG